LLFSIFGTLKRTVYILVLSFHILSITGLQELVRLPVLFQHYFEHKGVDTNITFLDYLKEHYNNDIPHTDDDEERDNQLPFKTHELCAHNVASSVLPSSFEVIPKKTYQLLPKQKTLIDNDHILSLAFAGKIWQPPQTIFS